MDLFDPGKTTGMIVENESSDMNDAQKMSQQGSATVFVVLLVLLLSVGNLMAELQPVKVVSSARSRLKMLRSPELQIELSIDAQQLQSIKPVIDQADSFLWKWRDLPPEQSNERALPLNKKLQEDLALILRPEQTKRLDQLVLRMEGWKTLQLPSVVNQMDLSGSQQQKYDEFLSGFQNMEGKTLRSIADSEFLWIKSVLTTDQRQRLSQLLGKPYDFSRAKILEAKAPELAGVDHWVNSPPLSMGALRGKVVIVNFWTFGCINCIHNLPHYKKWYAQLPRDRTVMIAIHTPETQSEYDFEKLKDSIKEKGLEYPIAVDNRKENWNAWGNNVWPSVYLVDQQGYVRNWWYGELNWEGATGEKQMLERIYQLMAERAPEVQSSNVAKAVSP